MTATGALCNGTSSMCTDLGMQCVHACGCIATENNDHYLCVYLKYYKLQYIICTGFTSLETRNITLGSLSGLLLGFIAVLVLTLTCLIAMKRKGVCNSIIRPL